MILNFMIRILDEAKQVETWQGAAVKAIKNTKAATRSNIYLNYMKVNIYIDNK